MMPAPCFESNMPVYGGNSGGSVFDAVGHVIGVNCTSYKGQDIAFHTALKGILDLWAPNVTFIPEDPEPRRRTVYDLGIARRIRFSPALSKREDLLESPTLSLCATSNTPDQEHG